MHAGACVNDSQAGELAASESAFAACIRHCTSFSMDGLLRLCYVGAAHTRRLQHDRDEATTLLYEANSLDEQFPSLTNNKVGLLALPPYQPHARA